MSELLDQLRRQLRADEGVSATMYRDHLGYATIGVGRLIDERKAGAGLRPHEIDYLLDNDIADRIERLTKLLPWLGALDECRRGVLLNMSFQLGVQGLLAFQRTLNAVRERRFDDAADAMLQSLWAKQTPHRARRLAQQMRCGEWQFAD